MEFDRSERSEGVIKCMKNFYSVVYFDYIERWKREQD